jgi:hypothetical protein
VDIVVHISEDNSVDNVHKCIKYRYSVLWSVYKNGDKVPLLISNSIKGLFLPISNNSNENDLGGIYEFIYKN